MDPVFVPIVVASIQIAGQVLASVINRQEQSSEDAPTSLRPQSPVRISREFLKEVIAESDMRLANLVESVGHNIIEEMRCLAVTEAVQDVQARVKALRQLTISPEAEDNQFCFQLVISALNPLHVSIEKANIRLNGFGAYQAWRCVNVIGTSALISGYEFLGQPRRDLREDLEKAVREVQIEILNELAPRMIGSPDHVFPWEQVPRFLSYEGAPALCEIYTRFVDADPQPKPMSPEQPAVGDQPESHPSGPQKWLWQKLSDIALPSVGPIEISLRAKRKRT